MNNHDKLGSRDIVNLALKLKVGVTVAWVLNSVDQGKKALGAKWPGFKSQHYHLTAVGPWESCLTSLPQFPYL